MKFKDVCCGVFLLSVVFFMLWGFSIIVDPYKYSLMAQVPAVWAVALLMTGIGAGLWVDFAEARSNSKKHASIREQHFKTIKAHNRARVFF